MASMAERNWFKVKLFYLAYYGGMACFYTFIILYYQSLGLTGQQIGLLSGLRPLTVFIFAPLWGALADATGKHKPVLLGTLGVTGLLGLAFAFVEGYAAVAVLSIVYSVFVAPVGSLIDNSVLAMLGERRDAFGRQRLWGSLGFAMVAPVIGWIAEATDLRVAFYGLTLCVGLAWLVVWRLPISGAQDRAPDTGAPAPSYRDGLARLVRNPAWALLMLTVVVISMGRATGTFVALQLDALGATRSFIGLVSAAAAASELPFFFYSDRMLRRWGAWGVLALCIVGSALDLAVLGVMPVYWLALPARLIHGASYAMLMVATVSYAHELAPPGLGATSQGILAAVQTGLGWGLGGFVAGALFDAVGASQTFLLGAGGLMLALGLLVVSRLASRRRGVA